ncbi:MAG TPA: biotin--[acetyl-CoA-carboxylase] ligase [Gemmatimonadaceae bacterium]|nr:biotin--[acetyl-CoA-carboxylase] ligase [Gemmatimonadaceae bacterium]
MADARPALRYDGLSAAQLAERAKVPRVELFDVVGSTMDEAHALASDGAPAGTVILADSQSSGRGRNGKRWSSPSRGVWMTLIERPPDPSALDVLSLRVGLAAARTLDTFAAEPVRVKWPNDLYVESAKLAGVLVEARWRGDRLDWVAIGLGVNMEQPPDQAAAVLEAGTSRVDVVCALLPELRGSAGMSGPLTQEEMDEYAARDLARGRVCTEPVRGRVVGIAPTGELLVELADSVARVRTGSLVLQSSNELD